jgi:hypothetical protein
MAEERGVLRRIVWRDVFPGIMLFRCFRLSIGLPVLFLATIGALLMPVGPWLAQRIFSVDNEPAMAARPSPAVGSPGDRPISTWSRDFVARVPALTSLHNGLQGRYVTLIRPFVQLFDPQASLRQFFGTLCVALWYLVVWSVCGGAITRIAVVRLGCGEQIPLRQSLRHSVTNAGWYIASPLFPLLGVALAVVPLFFLGLLMRLSIGVFVAGILWPLVLIVGLIMAVLLAGLLFGWPLMFVTISAEEAGDSFQAFSNSFSFTFQRPLAYLAYAVIALFVGSLGGMLVEGFANGVVLLNHWAISFGLGRERLNQLAEGQLDSASLAWMGSRLITIGDQLVYAIADGYYFGFLFCAASAIYLLLRREVDQTDFDQVYLADETERFSLPPLRPGPHGVPEVDEPPPATADRPSE